MAAFAEADGFGCFAAEPAVRRKGFAAFLRALADFVVFGFAVFAALACARFEATTARFPAFEGFARLDLLDRLGALLAATVFEAALLRTERTARVSKGAAAFKRFSTTGGVSSSPATRARAAPSDRAGADRREDGKAAPAADLLAFVFMAINVLGWRKTRTLLRQVPHGYPQST